MRETKACCALGLVAGLFGVLALKRIRLRVVEEASARQDEGGNEQGVRATNGEWEVVGNDPAV